MSEPLRIFHFDFNFVSLRPDYLRSWIQWLAGMGYNAALWELEDKISWETCPECVHPESITKEQFSHLLSFSRQLGLEPIPLLQTFGHAEYVLGKEKYFSFREDPAFHDCYCTSNPEVRLFLNRWVDEYLDLFGPIRYFHLGGDEAYRFATCPACKSRAAAVGRNRLYSEHLAAVSAPIIRRGVRPGIWCDMVLAHPGEMSDIPRDYLIWDWNYWDEDRPFNNVHVWGKGWMKAQLVDQETQRFFPEILTSSGQQRSFYTCEMLKRNGYDVVLCSSTRSGGDSPFCGRSELHGRNVAGAAHTVRRAGLVGHCVTSWAIRLFNYEIQAPWIRLAILADQNPDSAYDDLVRLCSRELFGIEGPEVFEAMALTGQTSWGTNSEHVGIQWNGLKDGLPAPAGYIQGLLGNMKPEDIRAAHAGQEAAHESILNGANRLNRLDKRSISGLGIIRAWQKAAYHQLWHWQLSHEVLRKFEAHKPGNIGDDLVLIRADYRTWAGEWMTPDCADHNTGLVFDALLQYLRA